MKLSTLKVPTPVCFCLVLALMMLLVPAVLIPFWVNRVKRIEGEIKVYTSVNELQSHFHRNIKFGFMLIILMMIALAISIFIFAILTIRAGRREMYLSSALIKQMEATQQEERKSMNKSTAFALANHDVRASLAGIIGLIEMCRSQASPESELVKNLNHMESCTNDLLAILNSILDQSKIEQGKMQLEEQEFNMEELLEHVVNIYYPNGAMKNVDVLLDPCDGSVARFSRVKGDRGELRRILSNLLHNAVKFTSEGHIALRAWARKPVFDQSSNTSNSSIGCMSCLHLQNDESSAESQVLNRVQQDPNCVEFIFEVDDTGKGIPKEKQKSVFENYVQVNDQTTSVHGSQAGTGLGLGITQSLVRLMGGEIGIVDKKIGEKGTCFRFNIFLIASDQPHVQEHKSISISYAGEEEDNLPSTDIVMAKPLHGSRLYRVLEFAPESEGTNLLTVTQEIKDETTSRMKIQQPPMRSRSPPLEAKRQDVSVDANGSSSENLPLTGKKILVVEDNRVLLMICKTKVSKLGATTDTCENGEKALALVRKVLSDKRNIGPSTPSLPFDYILMDCQMPEMDGFEATKCIREEEAHYGIRIPIIALTAHTKEVTDKIFQVGMDYYIEKPFDGAKLLKAIDYIEHREV
ncbi:histidine kinase CKI1-like [Lycium barbarum]|uniref:histidine kinase CKI1-like n=1 Tax=Lycium barbarum TaxID=112863 RepID=UPI00293F440D|nr:histidine kinase CKI1-like [Lycium barbarum]XP_060171467.1 histidine kinase CKI1-like [Lycium barbarum]